MKSDDRFSGSKRVFRCNSFLGLSIFFVGIARAVVAAATPVLGIPLLDLGSTTQNTIQEPGKIVKDLPSRPNTSTSSASVRMEPPPSVVVESSEGAHVVMKELPKRPEAVRAPSSLPTPIKSPPSMVAQKEPDVVQKEPDVVQKEPDVVQGPLVVVDSVRIERKWDNQRWIEARILNRGGQTLKQAQVNFDFLGRGNEAVYQRKVNPLVVSGGLFGDEVAPLKPMEERIFLVSVDKIPASWEGRIEPRVVVSQIHFSD
ncbi:MAG: hypothetical protein H7832_02540 [Magnetococcus sp. DMHC-6]